MTDRTLSELARAKAVFQQRAVTAILRPLPYDYARCGTPCAIAARCRRTTPGRDGYQSFSNFPGGDDCHGLIEGMET